MPGIDIYDDSYVEVITEPGVDKAKLVLKNELENQVYMKLCIITYYIRLFTIFLN